MNDAHDQSKHTDSKAPKPAKRWLVWLWRGSIALLVLLAIGVSYMLPMLMDKPDVSVDYLAKVNEPLVGVPESDWAWPIYREAVKTSGYQNASLSTVYTANEETDKKPLWPGHEDWPKAVAYIEKYTALIASVREGSQKPVLGPPVVIGESSEDLEIFSSFELVDTSEYSPGIQALVDGALNLQGHQKLMMLRRLARLLELDIRIALASNDAGRAIEDLRAIYALSKQSEGYDDELGKLVAYSHASKTYMLARQIVFGNASQFSDEQLQALKEMFITKLFAGWRFEDAEYLKMLDNLQRVYGRSGKVSRDGLIFWTLTVGVGPPALEMMNAQERIGWGSLVMLPYIRSKTATHDEMKKQLAQLQKDHKAYEALRFWEQIRTESASARTIERWENSADDRARYWLLLVFPPYSDSIARLIPRLDAEREVLLVAIALEQYKRLHGNFPDTLASLMPEFLSELPVDYSTGLALLYKLVDGKPLLYGRGLDNDDDGGVVDKTTKSVSTVPKSGDWILYPRPEDD